MGSTRVVSYLLDTHIWIWSVLDPDRLGRRVRRLLEKPDENLWLSPISLWELTTLSDRARIRLKKPVNQWFADAMAAAPLKEAPFTHDGVLAAREVVLTHPDPVDRFLAATARVLDCPLVTADERLLAGSGFRTLANR